MTKIGTLAEIGAKPGDTVRLVENGIIAGNDVGKIGVVVEGECGDLHTRGDGMNRGDNCRHKFQIVSRASDKPKLWRDMTPEEKGALLLAHHERKAIEFLSHFEHKWVEAPEPRWQYDYAYRIKPEPKVETVTMDVNDIRFSGFFKGHRITFNLINGEPDCTSIKMEKLSG